MLQVSSATRQDSVDSSSAGRQRDRQRGRRWGGQEPPGTVLASLQEPRSRDYPKSTGLVFNVYNALNQWLCTDLFIALAIAWRMAEKNNTYQLPGASYSTHRCPGTLIHHDFKILVLTAKLEYKLKQNLID